jgi:hypothetical protein
MFLNSYPPTQSISDRLLVPIHASAQFERIRGGRLLKHLFTQSSMGIFHLDRDVNKVLRHAKLTASLGAPAVGQSSEKPPEKALPESHG